jgi:hypothetical protein
MQWMSLLSAGASPLRLQLSLFGAASFLCFYLLAEHGETTFPPRLFLLSLTALGSFSFATLMLTGPVAVLRASALAAGLAVAATLLVWMASLRVSENEEALDPLTLLALLALLHISLPFLIAGARGRLRAYDVLFDAAWAIVVRGALAVAFVGLFWATAWLSQLLLALVGIDVLEDLFERPWFVVTLSGAVTGLALAVVTEWADYLSPALLVHLLRLLVVPLAGVSAVFLAAALINGLEEVFRTLSATWTLLSMAAVSTLLITSVIDRSEKDGATSPILCWAARILALCLPVMTALAAWAVWARVDQYGLTPRRVGACVAVALGLAYGLVYSVAALRGARWQTHIRRGNATLGLATLVVAALWLTPLLNPYSLSVNSQLARYEAGRTEAAKLPLWDFANTWGFAGQAAFAELKEAATAQSPLAEAVARAEAAQSRFAYEKDPAPQSLEIAQIVRALMIQTGLPAKAFADLSSHQMRSLEESCANGGCVTLQQGETWIILGSREDRVAAYRLEPRGEGWNLQVLSVRDRGLGEVAGGGDALLKTARSGGAVEGVAEVPALIIGENTLIFID